MGFWDVGRFLLIGANLVFGLCGLALLILGVYGKASPSFRDFLSEEYRAAAGDDFWDAGSLYLIIWVLILLGLVLLLSTAVGCCAAVRQTAGCLVCHVAALALLVCLTGAAALLLFFRRAGAKREVEAALSLLVREYREGPSIVRRVADAIQREFRCCGSSGCGDYSWTGLPISQPESCEASCTGCAEPVTKVLLLGSSMAGAVLLTLLVVQVLAILLSLCLCGSSGRRPDAAAEARRRRRAEWRHSAPSPGSDGLGVAVLKSFPLERSAGNFVFENHGFA